MGLKFKTKNLNIFHKILFFNEGTVVSFQEVLWDLVTLILLDKIWRHLLLMDSLMQHLGKTSFSWRMEISGFTRIKNMVGSTQWSCLECD